MKKTISKGEEANLFKGRVELIKGKIPRGYTKMVLAIIPEFKNKEIAIDLIRNVRQGKSSHKGITEALEKIVQDLELKKQIQQNEQTH